MADFISMMNGIPAPLLYLFLFVGAAIENLFPAAPADTFVALGGFLAGAGDLEAGWVALGSWLSNVVGALWVYRMSYRHGPSFFAEGWGRHLVRPHQMDRLGRFYTRYGWIAIFASRFLPGVRAIVPVFAGATRQSLAAVAVPVTVASAIWYGGLVYLGLLAGQNLALLERLLGQLNGTVALIALGVAVAAGWWWISTRSLER